MASNWSERINYANRNYNAWSIAFKCPVLEDYYEGKQWKFNTYFSSDPYVTNLVFSTIEIKAANLLLSYPKYTLTPRPGNSDYNQEEAIQSAQLKEDVLNTITLDEKEALGNLMELVFLDSQFRFGVVEVGYAADWVRNPLATPPQLQHEENVVGDDGLDGFVEIDNPKILKMPTELPDNEKIYFKHIPSQRFRVGKHGAQELERSDWCGYYEFINLHDLKVIDGIDSEALNAAPTASTLDANAKNYTSKGLNEEGKDPNGVKVWHIWDIRAKERLLILDSNGEIIWKDTFKRLPIKDLRWHRRLRSWYPMPPVYNWLSPQNEYNETREMMRSHRKRFIRKFQIIGDEIEQEEIDKFTNGEDGAMVRVPTRDAIQPIQNPTLDATVADALVISKSDFNEVSGTTNQDRGAADRTTATEAQRLGQKADVRDSSESSRILKFMGLLGREALLLAKERFVEGTWARLTNDPGEQLGEEMQTNPAYKWVTTEDLDDGYDFGLDVEIVSSSPVRNEDEKGKFVAFLAIVNQFPQIALSPTLVREAAFRCGYRNERVIKEMQKMAMVTMLGMQQQQEQQGGGGATAIPPGNKPGGQPSNVAQNKVAAMTPPKAQQVQQQISQQLQ